MRHNVESFTDLIVLGKNWGCGAEGARLLGMEKVGGSIPPSSIEFFNFRLMFVIMFLTI